MAKKGQEVMVPASEEALAQLRQDYPTEMGFNRTLLPRFGLVSQDITEEYKEGGKKKIRVISEAGTLFTEKQGEEEEVGEDGVSRKKWERSELGTETEGIILFQRKQLKYYDESTEKYTSSPVYDSDSEIIPLFLDKKEIARNTPAELKKLYPGVNTAGKAISKLEDNRILYVLIEGEVFQLNLRGSSMYSFLTYARKINLPPSVLTKFSSEAKEKGSINWNMMTFEAVRPITEAEAQDVIERVSEIKAGIAAEKEYYAANAPSDEVAASKKQADEDFEKF